MLLQVLGPVRAWRGDDPVDLGPAARRLLLALLALAGGKPLSRAEIMSAVWYSREPPATAVNIIQTHVKHLRRLLDPQRRPRGHDTILRLVGDGYALHMPAFTVDVALFRQGVEAAVALQRRAQSERAAEVLREALDLWHGPPLADLPALATHPKVVALAAERQAALGRYGELMIAAGRAAEGLHALEEAATAHPLDEAAHARLIRGYQAVGRRGQAFATYHEVRRRLADDLGVAPGSDLLAALAALLREEDARPAPATVPVPAQLPADVAEFTGRSAELDRLDALLTAAQRVTAARGEAERPAAAAICVVSGTAGVGKTTLAVHWAHRVARRFPDGQLYVNLRGFDPAGATVAVTEAVRQFLDALGVPGEWIPAGADAQAALYRSQMAGRRMLVVLDNARDAAQIHPLLPGGRGCLVVVTSRNRLADLVAVRGAAVVPVAPLPARDARELLIRRIGADRAAGAPQAVAEILAGCGGLPLALAIAAARAATSPGLPLAELAGQLRRDGERLDALSTGDPTTDLRAVFSWSQRALSPAAARLFRLLGLHPGPEVSTPAAASLVGGGAAVREALGELARANLVWPRAEGRYALHDLLRAYAADLARRLDAGRLAAATDRMLDHYVHSAHAASAALRPERNPIALAPPRLGVIPERPADHGRALAWFVTERGVLLTALGRAVSTGRDEPAWHLAWSMGTYLDRGGHWHDLVTAAHAALVAAGHLANPSAQAGGHRLLARAYTRLGRLDDGHAELRRALQLYRRAGDRAGQGHAYLNLSLTWDRRGAPERALAHARRALRLFEAAGSRHEQARALNAVGWYHTLLGDHRKALGYCERALLLLRELGDRNGLANTWESLGHAHHHLGHRARALSCYRHARRLYHAVGDRHLEGMVLSRAGNVHQAFGDLRAARGAWRAALRLLADLDRREAETVRLKLAHP